MYKKYKNILFVILEYTLCIEHTFCILSIKYQVSGMKVVPFFRSCPFFTSYVLLPKCVPFLPKGTRYPSLPFNNAVNNAFFFTYCCSSSESDSDSEIFLFIPHSLQTALNSPQILTLSIESVFFNSFSQRAHCLMSAVARPLATHREWNQTEDSSNSEINDSTLARNVFIKITAS